jgi:hypothetical protein
MGRALIALAIVACGGPEESGPLPAHGIARTGAPAPVAEEPTGAFPLVSGTSQTPGAHAGADAPSAPASAARTTTTHASIDFVSAARGAFALHAGLSSPGGVGDPNLKDCSKVDVLPRGVRRVTLNCVAVTGSALLDGGHITYDLHLRGGDVIDIHGDLRFAPNSFDGRTVATTNTPGQTHRTIDTQTFTGVGRDGRNCLVRGRALDETRVEQAGKTLDDKQLVEFGPGCDEQRVVDR